MTPGPDQQKRLWSARGLATLPLSTTNWRTTLLRLMRRQRSLRIIRGIFHFGRVDRGAAELGWRPEFSSKSKIEGEVALLVGTGLTIAKIIARYHHVSLTIYFVLSEKETTAALIVYVRRRKKSSAVLSWSSNSEPLERRSSAELCISWMDVIGAVLGHHTAEERMQKLLGWSWLWLCMATSLHTMGFAVAPNIWRGFVLLVYITEFQNFMAEQSDQIYDSNEERRIV